MGEFLQETFEEELDEQLSHLDIVDWAHLDKEKKLQLLYIIGSWKRKPSSVFRSRLRERSTQSRRSAGDNFREHSQDASVRHVIVWGERNMDVKFAGCCRPVFPDAIIWVVRRDGTCNVHRGSCGSLKRINPARQLEAYWEMLGTRGKYIQLRLVAWENGDDLIFDAVQVFYDMWINVIECRQNFDQHGADVLFTLEVSDQNKNISWDIRTRFSDRYPAFELHFSH